MIKLWYAILLALIFSLSAHLAEAQQVVTSNSGTEIYVGTTRYIKKYAVIAASSAGNNPIVAAIGGKHIQVLGGKVVASAPVNVKWRTASTDLEGLAYLTTSSGYVLPFNPSGWYVTSINEALNLNLSAAVPVGGFVEYIETN